MRQGLAIEHRPNKRLIDSSNDAFDLRMPALVSHAQVSHISGLRPGFADPVFSLNVTNEIQKPPRRYKIVNKVPARSEPRRGFGGNITHPLSGNKAAIGAARESRALSAKQGAANGRVYAVRTDQHVGSCYDTILKPSLDPIVVLPNFYTAMRKMNPIRRHGLSQHGMQFSAMKDVVGRPELGLDRLSKGRPSEGATILPP